ncbi:ATP phosphoribosyltransferase regulatory subunit [Pectinatus haikarae]|uniref:ATP phosphoribosyltransferase regulatory subunit n=1 Tax=Pectinatus haikarae TaxID=349096 RepID=A0ABT9Y5J0_9FIRM|nr:ATP phosphoribosyltransferase regulatory subunit [Pectinatus haikarae]MDQ0203106.1 ATP phosphoribosyltransferase regulatory subunit [Pectinatus haikarae]
MRDFLPHDAAIKRNIENVLANLFKVWGYDEVITPAVEYLDTLTMGNKNSIQRHMFKFFDKNNRTLALRNEMTTSIARLVSSRMQNDDIPFKLSYICKVYRYEQAQTGRQCEFYQAGVELMGNGEPTGDAEIVALAIESMLKAGLVNFQVCMGQVAFINGLMQQWNLAQDKQKYIRRALEKHDLVELDRITAETALPDEARAFLRSLPMLHGNENVLKKAAAFALDEQSKKALDNLEKIYDLLKNYGIDKYVVFDLGVIRDFSYYTGMVFEIYAPGLGSPLCGGGRYDNLLADFGKNCPATGFALGLERLMLALKNQGKTECLTNSKENYVAYAEGRLDEAVEKAMLLRDAGEITELAGSPQKLSEAEAYCRAKNYVNLVYIQ